MVTVDLYGQSRRLRRAWSPHCDEYGIPLIEDAAEALGATYRGRPAGSFGQAAVFSFNGNKIITTSGGGMLVSRLGRAWSIGPAILATQAREPFPHYEHSALGYNYRLSNLLAALGRAQLRGARRTGSSGDVIINVRYRAALGDVPGIGFMPVADYGEPNWLAHLHHWSTPSGSAPTRADPARARGGGHRVRGRPGSRCTSNRCSRERRPSAVEVCAAIFERGLCLPSGSSLSDGDLDRVVEVIRSVPG